MGETKEASMDPREEESPERLQRIISAFGAGTLWKAVRTEGDGSKNYVVRTDVGEYVLKLLYEPYDVADRIREASYAAQAAMHGIPTPGYECGTGGDIVHVEDGYAAMLQERVPGTHPRPTVTQAREIGRILAELATVPKNDLPRKSGWMQPKPYTERVDAVRPYRNVRGIKRMLALYDRLEDFRKNVLPKLPRSIIHADAHTHNMLFIGDTMTALLDWEEAAIGPTLIDYCVSAIGCCYDAGTKDDTLYHAFAAGYGETRPLTPKERAALPDCMAHVALGQATWRFLTHNVRRPNEDLARAYLRIWEDGLDTWTPPTAEPEEGE
jgi:Ser/Thr protein kinase RdoA (MazF antagonist)